MRDDVTKLLDEIDLHNAPKTRDQMEAGMDRLRARRAELEDKIRENIPAWERDSLTAKKALVQAQINALYWATVKNFTEDAWLEVK